MTRDRDIERVMEEWLRPGPIEMPDCLFESVLDRIERVPQRRLVRTVTRWFQMSPPARLAAIAAVVIVAIGAALLFTRPTSRVGTNTPSPSQSPTESIPSGSQLPARFQGHWYTQRVQTLSSESAPLRLQITFSELSVGWTALDKKDGLASLASLESNGAKLRVETRLAGTECPLGAVGLYDMALSPGGTILTLSNPSDACPLRATILSGSWEHSACKLQQQGVADDDCLGELEAGAYSTNYFAPLLSIGAAFQPRPASLSYEVPAGWANQQDWPWLYVLTHTADYRSSRTFENGEIDAISIWAHPVAARLGPNCTFEKVPGVGSSVNELVAWLSSNPTVATGPVNEGRTPLPSRWLDVSPNPKYTSACPGEPGPLAPTFTGATNPYQVAMGGRYPHRSRYLFVDVGNNESALVLIESAQKADFVASDFDKFASEAMNIAKTMQFVP